MELLIPEEISPISFKSSCFETFFPEIRRDKLLEKMQTPALCCFGRAGAIVLLAQMSDQPGTTHSLGLLAAFVCLPLADRSEDSLELGFEDLLSCFCQTLCYCTGFLHLPQT